MMHMYVCTFPALVGLPVNSNLNRALYGIALYGYVAAIRE